LYSCEGARIADGRERRIQSMPINPSKKKAAEGLFLPSYTVNQQALNIYVDTLVLFFFYNTHRITTGQTRVENPERMEIIFFIMESPRT
jgi:hypothetical protein